MNQQTNNNTPSNAGYPANSYPNGTYTYPPNPMPEDRPINWRQYLFLFLSNWYWFLITLLITLGIAFFKVRYTIPTYEASTTLIIEEEDNPQDILGGFSSVRYWRRRAEIGNERLKLSSHSTIQRAVDSLKQDIFWTAHGRIRVRPLYTSPRYQITILNDSLSWYKGIEWFIDDIDDTMYRFYREDYIDTILYIDSTVNINEWEFIIKMKADRGHETYSFIINNPNALTKLYRKKLKIETDEELGSFITLKSTGNVGEREADFLNVLAKTYILSGLERKQLIAENTFQFIDKQIDVILDSLNMAEKQLLTFRLSNNVINLSREGEMAYEQLKNYHNKRTELKLKENYYAYLKKYIEERNDPQTIIAPTLADANDQLLIGAVQELQQLYEERENMDISLQTNNPGLENINTRIQSIRNRIIEIVKGLIENNQLTLEQLSTEENAITDQLKKLPLNEQQLLNIKRKYDLYNQFYTFLLEKRAEAGIQKASTISNVRVLDEARYDQLIQVGNNKRTILIIAILIGFLLPFGIIFIYNMLDNRIKEREDITRKTNIPIVGIIGHSSKGTRLLVKEHPNSAFTEALRRIRANIQFILSDPEKKVIMVTSSVSGEGKTFTATNLATIFAMNNKRVLLIGCDLRKPSLHRIFNVKNINGLSSVLIGDKTFEECTLQTSIKNLHLLLSGTIPPNPAELLETKQMEILFRNLKQEYDYIILDTPPVALVSDSLSLARYSDITLYVIRQNFSQKDVISIASQMDSEQRLPNMTLLVNDIKPKRNLGYNYYYGYNRGYNYGYYDYSNYYSSEDD